MVSVCVRACACAYVCKMPKAAEAEAPQATRRAVQRAVGGSRSVDLRGVHADLAPGRVLGIERIASSGVGPGPNNRA